MTRLRIAFSKDGLLAYTSHLDLMRVWERSLRRAGLPLAYSSGFNPRARLQLAAALPLGHTGEAEMLDVWLETQEGKRGREGEGGLRSGGELEEFARAVKSVLPQGLSVWKVQEVDPQEPALQTQVVAAEYRVTVEWDETEEQALARIERLLEATELMQEKRGKPYDLRRLIERLWLERAGEGEVVLGMRLAAREGATARPEAVLAALGMGAAFARYHRRLLLEAAVPDGDAGGMS